VADDQPTRLSDVKFDRKNLYREETITDLKVGTIQRLVPIKTDGSRDTAREVIFVGQTQLLSQAGPVPVSARIEAADLEEALRKFPETMQRAVDRLVEQVKQLQREQLSRIVVPGQTPGVPKIIT
jgi:hypothetical protein